MAEVRIPILGCQRLSPISPLKVFCHSAVKIVDKIKNSSFGTSTYNPCITRVIASHLTEPLKVLVFITIFIQKIKSLSLLKINLLANYANRFWLNLLSFLLVPVYLHYLGIEAYGLIGAFYAVISFINLLDLGLSTTVSREVALRNADPKKQATIPNLLRTTEVIYWSIGIIILLIITLLAEPITTKWINFEKLDLETVKLTVLILDLTVAIRWPITPYRGTLMALEKQVQVNLLEVLLRSFRELGSVFILVIISPTIIPFILWQGLIAIIEVISMMVMAWHYQPKTREKAHFQIQILREVWQFAMGISWNMVASLLLSRIDIVLLSKLVSLEQFGYYMLASTLSQKLSTIIEPFLASTTPQLVTLISQKNKKEYTKFFYKISLSISLLTIPLASVLIFFASSIMELWTQSLAVATKSSNILAILTFGIMLNCISYVAYEIQIAIGKPQMAAIFNTLSLIFVVPAMILVVPTHHLFGAAIIKTSLNIFYFLINCLTLVKFIFPQKILHWLVMNILFPIIYCFAVCYIISHLYLIFPGKIMAILYIAIGLVINYVSLGSWYRYQLKYFQ